MQVSGDLTQKHCKPCEGGVEPLKPDEYSAFLHNELSGWEDVNEKKIEKEYKILKISRKHWISSPK